jgi:hypothetical protein
MSAKYWITFSDAASGRRALSWVQMVMVGANLMDTYTVRMNSWMAIARRISIGHALPGERSSTSVDALWEHTIELSQICSPLLTSGTDIAQQNIKDGVKAHGFGRLWRKSAHCCGSRLLPLQSTIGPDLALMRWMKCSGWSQ